MSNIKEQLIRLGSTTPSLRPHIRPLLNKLGSGPEVAEEIRNMLSSWLKRRSDSRHTEDAELTSNSKSAYGDFRTWDIPKDFDEDYGDEYEYYENVNRVISDAKKDLERYLFNYRKHIKSIDMYLGDKNYIEVAVNLK